MKIKIIILRVLFIISLIISLLLISDTFAKYQESISTDYKSNIKRWKLVINDHIVRNGQELINLNEAGIEPIFKGNDYVADDVIAPGREGYFEIPINFEQVDVPFSVEMTIQQYATSSTYNNLPDFQFYGYRVGDEETFYYNLPDGYKQVEYIEANGQQYLDTKVVADTDLVETMINFSTIGNENSMNLGGAENSITEENPVKKHQLLPFIENNTMYFSVGEDVDVLSYGIAKDKYYKLVQKYTDTDEYDDTKGGNIDITLNGTTIYQAPFSGTIKNNRNIWLFANNDEDGSYKYSKVRVKSFEYYKNSIITSQLVPCYRVSDGVIGMYDMVSATFLTNLGEGTFTKGKDIEKVVIDPKSEKYKDIEKDEIVYAYVRWVDGDGTTESLIDVFNNTEDTAFVTNGKNTDVKYKATAVFEQYIKE